MTAVETLKNTLNDELRKEFDLKIYPQAEPGQVRGTGYVVDTLHAARWAIENREGYEACVKAVIRLGDDTDTTACVTGGIAGLVYGFDAIPERWRQRLQGRNIVEPLVKKLLEWDAST